jgi:hypothetical protein
MEFYRDNVKYFLKLLYYRYFVSVALVLFLFLVIGSVLFILSTINRDLFNIAVFCTIAAFIFLGLVIAGLFLINLAYITGYSLFKDVKEESVIIGVFFSIGRILTNWRFILILFAFFCTSVLIIAGLYFYVIPNINLYHTIKVMIVESIKVALIIFILAFLLNASSLAHVSVYLFKRLFAITRHTLVIVLLALIAIIFVAGLYFGLSALLDPVLRPLFGIAS